MEADQNLSEFEAHNPVKSSEAVSQPASASQCKVNQSFSDLEACSNGSLYPSVITVQPLVANVRFDASVASEGSRNPSSRSTLSMTGASGSANPVLRTATEARRKLENTINEVGGQTRAQLATFSPVEFESTPVSTYPRRGHMDSGVVPEVVQSKRGNIYRKLDDEVIVRARPGDPLPVVPCLLYTSPSPRDGLLSRMPSSA